MDTLADPEFYNGIMKPLNSEHLRYFADQGWPLGFLLLIATREIVCQEWQSDLNKQAKGEWNTIKRYENRPGQNNEKLQSFCTELERLLGNGLKLVLVSEKGESVTVPLSKVESRLEDFLTALNGEAKIDIQGDNVVLRRPDKEKVRFAFPKEAPGVAELGPASVQFASVAEAPAEAPPPNAVKVTGDKVTRYLLVPRAPEGVVYYLGQLARAQEDAWNTAEMAKVVPWYRDENTRFALFAMRVGTADAKYAPLVEFEGKKYHVPGDWTSAASDVTGDGSLTTLTFVHLLFGLQRKGKEFPSTPVVIAQ